MTTARQLETNRANARRSTGPKTPRGKARVAQNAVTHGLLAHETLLPDEDPQGLQTLAETCGPSTARRALRSISWWT